MQNIREKITNFALLTSPEKNDKILYENICQCFVFLPRKNSSDILEYSTVNFSQSILEEFFELQHALLFLLHPREMAKLDLKFNKKINFNA